MRIENIYIVQTHAHEALVEAREQIFARSTVAVRSRPHEIARFGGDDHLVAVGREIGCENAPKILLRGAGRGAVIVREIEMRNPLVEGFEDHFSNIFERRVAAEVLPKAQ